MPTFRIESGETAVQYARTIYQSDIVYRFECVLNIEELGGTITDTHTVEREPALSDMDHVGLAYAAEETGTVKHQSRIRLSRLRYSPSPRSRSTVDVTTSATACRPLTA